MTDIFIHPEAVDHLCAIHEGYGQHGTVATLRALSAALTQSRAETAAAYERAACLFDQCANPTPAQSSQHMARQYATAIRALATPDQSSALAAVEAAAIARGMRKAAEIVDAKYAAGDMGNPGHHILAAIPQGDTTND